MSESAASRGQRLLGAGISSRPAAPQRWIPPSVEELAGVFPFIELRSLLGQGGMGAVYLARQTRLDRPVALKLLSKQASSADESFARRFQREGRILAKLRHPHIVALHDIGEAQGWQYLVMEYIEGATLREAMATGPFTVGAILGLLPQLVDALAYAHGQGIIHRDLKPENILIDERGQVRIADFGLAKLQIGERDASITGTGEVLGTAAYMAPEQLIGAREVDHRADPFARGVVTYELLTGRLPVGSFEKPSRRARQEGRLDGQIDERLDALVMRLLERKPEARWSSASELRQGLDALMPRLLPPRPAWQRPRMWLLCAGMILLGLAAGQLMVYARSGHPPNGGTHGGAGEKPAPPQVAPAPSSMPVPASRPAAAAATASAAPAAPPAALPPAAGSSAAQGQTTAPAAGASANPPPGALQLRCPHRAPPDLGHC